MKSTPPIRSRLRPSCAPTPGWLALFFIIAIATFFGAATPAWAGLEDLARSGEWRRVLEIASRRADQLPLNPEEAMIAANAARAINSPKAEIEYLEIAGGAEDEQLRQLAEVRLAELVSADEPDLAVMLAMPAFGRDHPWQVRSLATEVSRSVR